MHGLIVICAHCRKIQDENGAWQHVEVYVQSHTDARFSHGICPDCVKTLYPDLADDGQPGDWRLSPVASSPVVAVLTLPLAAAASGRRRKASIHTRRRPPYHWRW